MSAEKDDAQSKLLTAETQLQSVRSALAGAMQEVGVAHTTTNQAQSRSQISITITPSQTITRLLIVLPSLSLPLPPYAFIACLLARPRGVRLFARIYRCNWTTTNTTTASTNHPPPPPPGGASMVVGVASMVVRVASMVVGVASMVVGVGVGVGVVDWRQDKGKG